MASLHISLPEALKEYVESQVADGNYLTPSEYLGELVRQDQRHRSQERLAAVLLEGRNSGPPVEVNDEYLTRKESQLIDRHSRKSKQ